jgi:hypothetical protein
MDVSSFVPSHKRTCEDSDKSCIGDANINRLLSQN